MSTRNDNDDEAAWALLVDALDEALTLDLSPETRGAMTRYRGLVGALVGVPLLRAKGPLPPQPVNARPPLAEVVPLRRAE
jgi:hypothetical protein